MLSIIASIVGVLGFLLSLYSLVSRAIKARETYTLSVIDYDTQRIRGIWSVRFLVCIENRSDSPLCIVSVSLDGVACTLEPKPVRGNPGAFDFQATAQFPLSVAAHHCRYFYLDFPFESAPEPPLTHGTPVSFCMRSTRRATVQTLPLPHMGCYLHTRDMLKSLQASEKSRS